MENGNFLVGLTKTQTLYILDLKLFAIIKRIEQFKEVNSKFRVSLIGDEQKSEFAILYLKNSDFDFRTKKLKLGIFYFLWNCEKKNHLMKN